MAALQLYLALVAVAGVATLVAFVIRRSVTPMALVATVSWAVASLQTRNVEIYFDNGSVKTVGFASLQFVFLLLAILSLAAFIGSIPVLGFFPPDDQPEVKAAFDNK